MVSEDFGSFKISKVPFGGAISNVKTPGWLNTYRSADCTGPPSEEISLRLLHDEKYIRGDRCFYDSKMIVKSSSGNMKSIF